MTDEFQEHKTLLFKIPDGRTLTGTATLEMPTLRDQFAMAALTGLLSASWTMGTREGYCKGAYEFADDMLAARKENQ